MGGTASCTKQAKTTEVQPPASDPPFRYTDGGSEQLHHRATCLKTGSEAGKRERRTRDLQTTSYRQPENEGGVPMSYDGVSGILPPRQN